MGLRAINAVAAFILNFLWEAWAHWRFKPAVLFPLCFAVVVLVFINPSRRPFLMGCGLLLGDFLLKLQLLRVTVVFEIAREFFFGYFQAVLMFMSASLLHLCRCVLPWFLPYGQYGGRCKLLRCGGCFLWRYQSLCASPPECSRSCALNLVSTGSC